MNSESLSFTDRIQHLCPALCSEQITELRDYLVYASGRLEAEPALMDICLTALVQDAKDQGYDWANEALVADELIRALAASDAQEQIMAEWHTCLSSEGTVADFAEVLTARFPAIKADLLELLTHAKNEHRALSGVGGGFHAGHVLGSSWTHNPNATKKQSVSHGVTDSAEVVAAGVIVFAASRYIYQNHLIRFSQGELEEISSQTSNDFIDISRPLQDLNERELDKIAKTFAYSFPFTDEMAETIHFNETWLSGGYKPWSDLTDAERASYANRAFDNVFRLVRSQLESQAKSPATEGGPGNRIKNPFQDDNVNQSLYELQLRANEDYTGESETELADSARGSVRRDRIAVDRELPLIGNNQDPTVNSVSERWEDLIGNRISGLRTEPEAIKADTADALRGEESNVAESFSQDDEIIGEDWDDF